MTAIRNMKASRSCCFRLVNQSTCGHVRRTQRGKWYPESSDCVLSTAALLRKTRERQPAHSRPQIVRLESCALRLRSVDNERGHSQGYLGQLRSRSRVDSAMALLIWNGQSEKRQRPGLCLACAPPTSLLLALLPLRDAIRRRRRLRAKKYRWRSRTH